MLKSNASGIRVIDRANFNVKNCLVCDHHKIRKLQREAPAWLLAMVILELGKLVDFVDAKKTLSDEDQLIFAAEAILEDYDGLNLEELILIFEMIKKGRLGKFYERMKYAEIQECIKLYIEKHQAPAREQLHKHDDGYRYDPTKINYKPMTLGSQVKEVLSLDQKKDYGRRRMAEDAIDTPDSASPENCEHEPPAESED